MSYEHCDGHDMDATNGCPACNSIASLEALREELDGDRASKISSALELVRSAVKVEKMFCPSCGVRHSCRPATSCGMVQGGMTALDRDERMLHICERCSRQWWLVSASSSRTPSNETRIDT